MKEDGYVSLAGTVIKNTFQALEHPKIVGKKTVKSQNDWYNSLLEWASQENDLITLWATILKKDEWSVRRRIITIAKAKLKLISETKNPL